MSTDNTLDNLAKSIRPLHLAAKALEEAMNDCVVSGIEVYAHEGPKGRYTLRVRVQPQPIEVYP